nr:hypothetical protein [Malassezia furfur]WBU10925.1 hypothetical protein [Malassezia furfur]
MLIYMFFHVLLVTNKLKEMFFLLLFLPIWKKQKKIKKEAERNKMKEYKETQTYWSNLVQHPSSYQPYSNTLNPLLIHLTITTPPPFNTYQSSISIPFIWSIINYIWYIQYTNIPIENILIYQ